MTHGGRTSLAARLFLLFAAGLLWSRGAFAAESIEKPGDRDAANYFKAEAEALAKNCLADLTDAAAWNAGREKRRGQLLEMLGLQPLPDKSDLNAVTTRSFEQETFTVEDLHFQSLPGLYVTANLYLPKNPPKPCPAILYVCGHSPVATNGISYGNKTAYQHHGAWFARHGYVCLTLDTIQLGEIQGIHHGTYREGMWWWNSRGYTPAGVEAWNGIRALDYLQSRKEVDPERIGVTGRSGGGAYSWWVAALDDRIKAAAPVAGITDLQNHVVDGAVEGHCDCMFMVNTHRWDYPMVAALVAPRPLLIGNSDKDPIFPLDGVRRLHEKVSRVYELFKATNKLGLVITEGPHKDTPELQKAVFEFFNRHLKGEVGPVTDSATPFFTPEQLRVLDPLPADEITSKIHETFTALAKPAAPPRSESEWFDMKRAWKEGLKTKVFAAWPGGEVPLNLRRAAVFSRNGVRLELHDFDASATTPLRLYIVRPDNNDRVEQVSMNAMNENEWPKWLEEVSTSSPPDALSPVWAQIEPFGKKAVVFFGPRGVGASAWGASEKGRIQMRRRFMLLGTTLDAMRVWDLRRSIQALRLCPGQDKAVLTLNASGTMAANALYAAAYEKSVQNLRLKDVPNSHRQGPDYPNVLRILDLPQVMAMALETADITLEGAKAADWQFPLQAARALLWQHLLRG